MSIISNNIPNPTVPLIDPNGRLSTVWFQFFLTLFARTGNGTGLRVDDVLSEAQQGAMQADLASANAMIAMVEALAQQAIAVSSQKPDERGESGDAGTLASVLQKVAELEARIEAMSQPVLTDTAQLTNGAQFLAEGKPIGSVTPNTGAFTTLTTTGNLTVGTSGSGALAVASGFGCNGKTAQPAYSLGAAAVDAATTQTLANNIRAALIANGTGA